MAPYKIYHTQSLSKPFYHALIIRSGRKEKLMAWYSSSNKYKSTKTEVNGILFDSKKEAKRYSELLMLQNAGLISNLQTQVKFVLIPAQRELSNEVYSKGKNKGMLKPGRVIEKECAYIADFVYTENGVLKVEDTKGFRTKDYIIKRKLMLYVHGIRVVEI